MDHVSSWQNLLDGFEEPAGILSADQKLVCANAPFLSLFGVTRHQMHTWSNAAFIASLRADARSMLFNRNGMSFRVMERRIDSETGHNLITLRKVVDLRDELLQTGSAMAEVMVHRLRSPLTGVRGFLEIIQESPEGAMHQAELGAMSNGLGEVTTILDQLYELAVPPSPALTQVNYRQILNNVLERFNVFDRRRVFVRSEASQFSWIADAVYLHRIFFELIKNALEHNREEPAQVHVVLGNRGFEVANAGAAIPDEIKTRLFTPFFTTKARGLGLGLAQSRLFARKMNADIALKANSSVTGIVFKVEFVTTA